MDQGSSYEHAPVMLETVVGLLGVHAQGRYVDGTIGGGGYAQAILEASAPDGVLLGLDWDGEAIGRVQDRLSPYRGRIYLARACFAALPEVLKRMGWESVDGIVLDLGISSIQLDDPERGFSFLRDGPLDMRMDRSRRQTAADLVNSANERDLAHLISRLGEERWAGRIARAIAARRRQKPFARTLELAELIERVVPKTRDSRRIHPATRTFQALRLAVNEELQELERFLAQVLSVLNPGGRLCIVAFHSLEDRIVKLTFREWGKSCRCTGRGIPCQCEGKPLVRLLTRKALRPTQTEIEANPRSRSARVRAVEKC